MNIEESLSIIQNLGYLTIPKNLYSKDALLQILDLENLRETQDKWQFPVTHMFYTGATETQIVSLSENLQYLPKQLERVLRITNGASLFQLHYRGRAIEDYQVARYKMLSCSELLTVNMQILDTFLAYAESDPEVQNVSHLNYLAFCDVGDGNYLALTIENDQPGIIFFLDHEYAYYPYGIPMTHDGYIHVASSLEQWLKILIESNGWSGMGNQFVPM